MNAKPARRELHFDSMDDVVAEVDRLANGPVTTTGHYSFGQILEHLARTLDVAVGHVPPPPIPAYMRVLARAFRPFAISRPARPGFKLPSKAQSAFWPSEEVDVDAAVTHFKEAVDRFNSTEPLPKHPLFGMMNRPQSVQLQCRHCELHLSFVSS